MPYTPMQIAYTINSGVDLFSQNAVLLWHKAVLTRLRELGYTISFFALAHPRVIFTDDWDFNKIGKLGISKSKLFLLVESVVRRTQGILRLPYLGLFDSIRFYDACCKNLGGYDIFFDHAGILTWGSILAAKRLKKPVVLDIEADYIKENALQRSPMVGLQKTYAKLVFKKTLQCSDAIVVLSKVLRDELINHWGVLENKIHIIPLGVDTEFISPDATDNNLRYKLGVRSDEIIITFIGGFYPWHGVIDLVKSFCQITQRFENVRLLLVGDGELMPSVREKVKELDLYGTVMLTGQVDHSDIPQYLSISDICIAPYPFISSEIWFSPLKLFEYMAAGKAVVASRTGQVSEIIDNLVTGMLVDPGDINGLTDAITYLVTNPEERKRLGSNARTLVANKYSWNSYVQKLLLVFNNVLEKINAPTFSH